MPMRTLLDVTTGHLKKQDREALQRIADSQKAENWPTPHVYEQEYGWYISAGVMYGDDIVQGQERLRNEGFSEEFIALMTYAQENDVAMVNFDSDGEPEPGFKIFDEYTDEENREDDAAAVMSA
jgi:hypothetical protein